VSLRSRGKTFYSRLTVPTELRPLVARREVVRSLNTADRVEARLRASQWEARVASLFAHLRRNAKYMDSAQIEALVAETLDTKLLEIEERIANDEWRINGPDWNEIARQVLDDKAEEYSESLAENDLSGTLEDARRMAPELSEGSKRVLARRLLEVKLEACLAEIRALEGAPLRVAVIAPRSGASTKKSLPKSAASLSQAAAAWLDSKRTDGKFCSRSHW
jgi:hypothetical protein